MLWFLINCALLPIQRTSGYLSPRWNSSGLIAAVKQTRPGTVIYSNDAAACYFLGNRPARFILDDIDKPNDSLVDAEVRDIGNGATIA